MWKADVVTCQLQGRVDHDESGETLLAPRGPMAGMLTVVYDMFAASYRHHRSILSERLYKGRQNNCSLTPVFPWPDHNDIRRRELHTLR